MPSLTDGEVVQNFQSRALKLSRELDSVRRELAERERELSAAEKVETLFVSCRSFLGRLSLISPKVLAFAHSHHVRLQAETDPLIRSFEEASDALKDGDDRYDACCRCSSMFRCFSTCDSKRFAFGNFLCNTVFLPRQRCVLAFLHPCFLGS
jgi:hypothetical protein